MMYTTSTITDNIPVDKAEKRNKTIKSIVRFTVSGLVEIFIGAVTNSVLGRVDGSRAAKFGAKAGGFLVGMYLGDKVSDYILTGIDDATLQLEELKAKIEEES